MSKIIQYGGFLGSMLGNLGKEAPTKFAVPLNKDVFPKLITKAALSVTDKLERKISGQGSARAGKGCTLFK